MCNDDDDDNGTAVRQERKRKGDGEQLPKTHCIYIQIIWPFTLCQYDNMGIATVIYMRQNKYVRPVDLYNNNNNTTTSNSIVKMPQKMACNVLSTNFLLRFRMRSAYAKVVSISIPKTHVGPIAERVHDVYNIQCTTFNKVNAQFQFGWRIYHYHNLLNVID